VEVQEGRKVRGVLVVIDAEVDDVAEVGSDTVVGVERAVVTVLCCSSLDGKTTREENRRLLSYGGSGMAEEGVDWVAQTRERERGLAGWVDIGIWPVVIVVKC